MTLVEPGGFATDWSGPERSPSAQPNHRLRWRPASGERSSVNGLRGWRGRPPRPRRRPCCGRGRRREPPLRVFFGASAFDIVRPDYESRLAGWEKWDDVAKLAQG